MKQLVKIHGIAGSLLLLIVTMAILVSCDDIKDEEHEPYDVVIPSSAYSFTISSSSDETSTTVYAMPNFTANFDSLGLKVKEVKYYIDQNLVSTETTNPFYLDYTTDLMASGTHSFRADFTVGGTGFKDATASYSSEFDVSNNNSASTSPRFNIDFDRYVLPGNAVNFSVTLIDKYNVGYTIDEINIYWASTLIGTGYESPYTLSYVPSGNLAVQGGSYGIAIDIKYHAGNTSGTYSYSSYVTIMSGDMSICSVTPGFNDGDHFSNGDDITAVARLYRIDGDQKSYEVNMYLDDNTLIGNSSSFPYNFTYTLQNLSKGIHKLTYQIVIYDEETNYTSRQSSSLNFVVDN